MSTCVLYGVVTEPLTVLHRVAVTADADRMLHISSVQTGTSAIQLIAGICQAWALGIPLSGGCLWYSQSAQAQDNVLLAVVLSQVNMSATSLAAQHACVV